MRKITIYVLLMAFVTTLYAQMIDTSQAHYMRVTYYHNRFEGRLTSNGERFSQRKYTAAHLTYKFGTLLLVTDPTTNKWVIVRVNDRCPKKGILDLSRIAAKQLGILQKGTTEVMVVPLPNEYYEVWQKQMSVFNSTEASELACFTDIIDVLNSNISSSKAKEKPLEPKPEKPIEVAKREPKPATEVKKHEPEKPKDTKQKQEPEIKATTKAKVYYKGDTVDYYEPLVFE